MSAPQELRKRLLLTAGAMVATVGLVAACGGGDAETPAPTTSGGTTSAPTSAPAGGNDEPGDPIVIGFSGPAADHGWLAAINKAAIAEAAKYSDVTLDAAEGTNDPSAQISAIESFISKGVDVIVLLPTDGAALTDIAIEAMNAGIPVVNVDREFSSPFAARTTVLGDNYGMGVSAGTYICEELEGTENPVIAEIQGIASLPLTQDRSQGFEDALAACGMSVTNQVSAEFTVESGNEVTANLLQAAPKIDAIWNHDDDQGLGVLAAIQESGRNEFFLVGGAGSINMMQEIQNPESIVKATVLYPPTQAADGIRIARLIAQGRSMSDLVQVAIPKRIVLDAPVVTAENVEEYLSLGFDS